MKKIIVLVFISVLCFDLFAIEYLQGSTDKAWHLIETAKIAIERKEFGNALLYVERAVEVHTQAYKKDYEYLKNALKPRQVKKAGDDISEVYKALKERDDYDACKIMDTVFLLRPPVFFDFSISRFMSYLKEKVAFPEADYITGNIYSIQDEYTQAMFYYERAYSKVHLLEIPDERFSIIYSIADVAGLLGKHDMQEKYLLLVLTEDPTFGSTVLESSKLKAMLNTIIKEKTTDKFFRLYRVNKEIALKAYRDLSRIYIEAGNTKRSLTTSALAASIALTSLSQMLEKADFSYVYSDFKDVLSRVGKNTSIRQWAENKNLWDVFINFADAMEVNGYSAQAIDMYHKIAESVPSVDYAQRAMYKASSVVPTVSVGQDAASLIKALEEAFNQF
ncbi:MAG: hypothetical protein ACTTKH_06035 [Treponema sp.]